METTDPTTAQELTLSAMVSKFFTPDEGPGARLLATTDIFEIIDQHAPQRYHISEMHDALTALNFQACAIGDVIYWSLRNL